MKRRTAALAGLLLLALSACAGKKISDVDAPQAAGAPSGDAPWTVPRGVVVRPGASGAADIDGLYPSTVPGDRRCCWLAVRASVLVRAPRAPATLHVDVLVPEYPFFETAPQELKLAFGSRTAATGPLAPGVHRLRFDAVSSTSADGLLSVGFHSLRAFVPAHEGVDADTRSLGIILLGISFAPADASGP